MNEKTIQICGHDVRMRYCTATETGFERLRGKSIYDIDFKTLDDTMTLAIAAIIAAYARTDEQPPVNTEDLLYDARPDDIILMVSTVLELRGQWYSVPDVVPKDPQPAPGDEKPKN